MNIDNVNISTFPIDIADRAPLSSESLRAFVDSVSDDLANLGNTVNEDILGILNTLPETDGVDAKTSGLDGTALYVDSNGSSAKDYGLFYNAASGRPLSVYETFLFFIQIISNMDNGLKEGISVGSITAPVTIAKGGSVTFDWPYFDGTFDDKLFQKTNNTITKVSDLNVSVDYAAKKITIQSPTSDITLWGYIWHPVYSF